MIDQDSDTSGDSRLQGLCEWVSSCHGSSDSIESASSDASFRRYFRFRYGGTSFIGMDAPPPQENCQPFVDIARLLESGQVKVPRIVATDIERGYLLLEDLGSQLFIDVLDQENADQMFSDAIDTLIALQEIEVPESLPSYDAALLRRELDLFRDWYLLQHVGVPENHPAIDAFERLCAPLITNALEQPRVLVHRDYMPRNLMISDPNPGVLDFQDAVHGPVSYDVVSLFRDAFISWPEDRVDSWLRLYWQRAQARGLPVMTEWDEFLRRADLMGTQRHLKVIGIFARLCYRDGKSRYLEDTPRFFAYLEATLRRHPDLRALDDLLRVLPLADPGHSA